jgi:hypothetical protein
MQSGVTLPKARSRTHSKFGGQHCSPQTWLLGGHGLKQTTPRTQTSSGPQQFFEPGGPQNVRPSSQMNCSWQSPLPVGEQVKYHGQHDPAKPSDV